MVWLSLGGATVQQCHVFFATALALRSGIDQHDLEPPFEDPYFFTATPDWIQIFNVSLYLPMLVYFCGMPQPLVVLSGIVSVPYASTLAHTVYISDVGIESARMLVRKVLPKNPCARLPVACFYLTRSSVQAGSRLALKHTEEYLISARPTGVSQLELLTP
jgi:hypothetical protein